LESKIFRGIERIEGKEAWQQGLRMALFVSNKVRSSFGPKGAYKMVTYNRGPEQVIKITKDPIPVLEEFGIQYPAVKIISEAAKIHRDEMGDGVISFIILLSGLLREGGKLMDLGVHPNQILCGYLNATKRVLEIVNKQAFEDKETLFYDVLSSVDCGKGLLSDNMRQMVIQSSARAIRDGKVDKEKIRILKKAGGSIKESRFIEGLLIQKDKVHPSMPDLIDKPKIVFLSGKLGIQRLKVKMKGEGHLPMKLNFNDQKQIEEYRTAEFDLKIAQIEKVKSIEANVIISMQPIDDHIKGKLAEKGIFALESVSLEDLKAASDATGGRIVGDIGDLSESDLGSADKLEVIKIESEKVTAIEGCKGSTFLLRGSMSETLDEYERIIKRGITALGVSMQNGHMVFGGGAIEMQLSHELGRFALDFSGTEQLAVRGYGEALEDIPRNLAESYGLNPLDVIADLRGHHGNNEISYGVSENGCSDMVQLKVYDLAESKSLIIRRAYDVAKLILRVDDFMIAKEIPKVHKQ
jgi:chaperonin GroEL (HSP60 family)